MMHIDSLNRLNAVYTLIPSYLFFFMYDIYFVKLWGATPGKLIAKVKIIKKNGSPVDWHEAFLRYIVQLTFSILSSIALLMPLFDMTDAQFSSVGFMLRAQLIISMAPFWYKAVNVLGQVWIWSEFIILLCNKRKRALHDFVAGTVVIKKEYDTFAENWFNAGNISCPNCGKKNENRTLDFGKYICSDCDAKFIYDENGTSLIK